MLASNEGVCGGGVGLEKKYPVKNAKHNRRVEPVKLCILVIFLKGPYKGIALDTASRNKCSEIKEHVNLHSGGIHGGK